MATYNRPPSAPNLSPSLLQGYWTRPEGRGRSAEELSAQFPRFSSWEAAIAELPQNPLYQTLAGGRDNDAYRTMFLREAYGLPQNYAVRGGRLVSDDNSLRNGLLGGAAMIGGMSALGALTGGGGAAAAGSGLSTGATVAPATSMGAALGGAAVPGATGAATGAGMGFDWLGAILDYGVPTAGRLITAGADRRAMEDATRQQMDYYNRALDIAKEQQGYQRVLDRFNILSNEERLAFDRANMLENQNYGRGQYANFVETLEPYRAAGEGAVGRMSHLLGAEAPAPGGSYAALAQLARTSQRPWPTVGPRPTFTYGA